MTLTEWNTRYLDHERASDFDRQPTPLLVETTTRFGRLAGSAVPSGEPPSANPSALDIACGTGRNALWLAHGGWTVTAIDGAEAAIETLRRRAEKERLSIDARTADLASFDLRTMARDFDLVLMSFYLQRGLYPRLDEITTPGAIVIAIVHTVEGEGLATPTRALPGELATVFQTDHSANWQILHTYEGPSRDPAHHRPVAEIVARKQVRTIRPAQPK